MKSKIPENYYVGLDIGTDSVGYAVTSESFELSKFKGELCSGVQLHVTDREAFSPFAAGVKLVEAVRNMYGTEFDEKATKRTFGTSRLFDKVDSDTIINDCIKTSKEFQRITSPYYIYK